MKVEDFENSLEYRLLTPTEREFTVSLIETGDISAATKAAFPHAKNQTMLRAKMRRNTHVLAALRLWYGRPAVSPKEETVDDLKRQIRRLKGVAKVAAMRLLCQLQGLVETK